MNKRRYERHPWLDRVAAAKRHSVYVREWQERKRAAGLCAACGKNKSKTWRCQFCTDVSKGKYYTKEGNT